MANKKRKNKAYKKLCSFAKLMLAMMPVFYR